MLEIMFRCPSKSFQFLNAGHAVAIVTATVLSWNITFKVPLQLEFQEVGIVLYRCSDSTTYVIDLKVRLVVSEDHHIRLDDVLHVHKIAGLQAILVEYQRFIGEGLTYKNATNPGIVV